MKIGVVGVGGVGGYFGGVLARAGHSVSCLARGPHLAAIQERGLRVESVAGDFTVRPRATADAAAIGPVDLVLFGVKTYDTEPAGRAMAPLVGPDTVVLTLQNGVDSGERLAAVAGAGYILAGAAYIFSAVAGPGVVRQTAGPCKIVFGEADGTRSSRAQAVLAALQGAGIAVELTDAIARVLWEKWAFICAQGGVTSVTRLPIGVIRACAETWAFFRGVGEEIVALAAAGGPSLSAGLVERILSQAAALDPQTTSSLHHDVTHGHRLEIEALNGTAVRLGRARGVPTPLNLAITAALKPYEGGAAR